MREVDCRSSENLVSIAETERHCVAGGLGQLKVLDGSTSSLSSGGWENGEEEEEGEFSASVQLPEGECALCFWC